jgi:hypothetical protein
LHTSFSAPLPRCKEQVSKLIGTELVIINCLHVPLDLSGLFALAEMIDHLKQEKIQPTLAVRQEEGIRRQMLEMGYGDLLGSDP